MPADEDQALQTLLLWRLWAMAKQAAGAQHSSPLGAPWQEVAGVLAHWDPH